MADYPNEKGKAFTEKLAEAGYEPAQLAHTLGVGLQNVNNWKDRGVSREFANEVAELLACEPSQISKMRPRPNTEKANEQAAIRAMQKRIRDKVNALSDLGHLSLVETVVDHGKQK